MKCRFPALSDLNIPIISNKRAFFDQKKWHNAGLQLRRAISIQAKGTRLLEKHAIAPSAARLCYVAQREETSSCIKQIVAAPLSTEMRKTKPVNKREQKPNLSQQRAFQTAFA
jgi:hypothetical protein